MTRKQAVLMLAASALVSLLVSVAVVSVAAWLILDRFPIAAPSPTLAEAAGPPATEVPPAATPIIHVVAAGDTITGLALQYDVPAEEIVAANRIDNPNLLQVGTKLVIPVSGVPIPTATFTPAPTATETPPPWQPPSADMTATAAALIGATITPFPTPLPSTGEVHVEISQILNPGQLDHEAIVLANVGNRVADLAGWTLSDTQGNVYPFPNYRLWPGGSVTVYSRVGQDGSPVSSLYWGKLQAVWSPKELATLKDDTGQVVATYVEGQP